MGKLNNSLIEMLVLVGANESTGLLPREGFESHGKSAGSLTSGAYKMEILAAISENIALFPSTPGYIDNQYPPGNPKSAMSAASGTWPRPTSMTASPAVRAKKYKQSMGSAEPDVNGDTISPLGSPKKLLRQTSTRSAAAYRPVDFIQHRLSTEAYKPAEFPLSTDTLNSLVLLCFPDSAITVQTEPLRDSVHYLCLTDISGDRSYATCLTRYTKYFTYKSKHDNMWKLSEESTRRKGEFLCYVPCCYVMISKYPYFSLLKDVLSRMVIRLDHGDEVWSYVLKETALHLCLLPVPPPGGMHVEFEQHGTVFTAVSPPAVGRPVVDWSLGVLLQCFSADVVVDILTCLLTQQRLVFISTSYTLIPLITESLLQLLLPFQWHYTYVPVTPESLLELMEAPGTYIMGCHAKHKCFVQQMDGGPFVVDLDKGKLLAPSGCEDLPVMPAEPAAMFKESYRHLQHQHHVEQLDWRREFSYEDAKEQELQQRQKLNSAVSLIFLELMANLFRNVLVYIKPERNFFHKDVFLAGLEENDIPFYQQVLDTLMFSTFLRARLNKVKDYWTDLVELTRPQLRNSLASGLDHIDSRFSLRKTSSVSALSSLQTRPSQAPSTHFIFRAPNFQYILSPKYMENCANMLSQAVKASDSASTRASLLYMRGMELAALGHRVKALEDFHTLASCDNRLLPSRYIGQLVSQLDDEEKQMLQDSVFYPNSPIIHARDLAQKHTHIQTVNMDLNKLPRTDITEAEFVELLKILEIASDHDAITRLFTALVGDKGKFVDASTFEEFYKCWKANEVEIQNSQLLSVLDPHLDPNEALLILSQVIKCSYGMGRIGLTHKRVFYLQESTNNFKNVIRLRDIKSVDVFQQRSFLSVMPAVKIYSKEEKSKSFTASLKQQSAAWQGMLNEMWAGKMVSEEMMDPAVIQLAAQNILLLHAYITSGLAEFSCHNAYAEEKAPSLCYYTKRWKQGEGSLPPETKDVLQHRVDPSSHQPMRTTIEALLYTAGRRSGDADDADTGPQLWCGLGSGRVEVYDASSWIRSSHHVQADDRVVCLCAVGENRVWAGSFDKVIYIIDVLTHSCHQTLRQHTDIVTDICITPENSHVFSSSINGQILQWDTATCQNLNTLDLPDQIPVRTMLYHQNSLWCATQTELYQVSVDDGHLMRKLGVQIEIEGKIENLQLDCFLFTPTKELWIGMGRQGEIVVYNPETWEIKTTLTVECRGVSKMVQIGNKIWVGSKAGKLYIFDCVKYEREKVLQAHEDSVRAMCSAQQRYVITGAGSHDGRVAIWRASSTAIPQ